MTDDRKRTPIAAGWQGYLDVVMPHDAPQIQRDECRKAYYAGAATLFYALMKMLDPGEEPTEKDLANMSLIHAELDAYGKSLDTEVLKAHGGWQ